jgi:hypothetical protein
MQTSCRRLFREIARGCHEIQTLACHGAQTTCPARENSRRPERDRCWGGENLYGQLGYAHERSIGDDETPASAGSVNVGGSVIHVEAGGFHTCALLSTKRNRCWGYGFEGALGYRNTNDIGDNESPASAGNVSVF